MRYDLFSGFPTMSDINQTVQPQKMAIGLKFRIWEVEELCYVAKTKALISLCAFVLAYTKTVFFETAYKYVVDISNP